jgi:uncharacterized protein YndB with AHSA1/START domain
MVVERKIFVAASPETVFGFLVDGALMAQWFGLSHTLEPRPGGLFRVECSNGNVALGQYTEVVPHRRVAFTWGWEPPNLTSKDFGGGPPLGPYPYLINAGPHAYMILNVGEAEKTRINRESQDLIKDLCAYRSNLCIDGISAEH